MEPTFLYFAYGSNLLKERLQLHNPSAAVHCVARLQVGLRSRAHTTHSVDFYLLFLGVHSAPVFSFLQDYKLTFGNDKGRANDRWHGGVATMQPCSSQEVWGVVWRMNLSDLASLDRWITCYICFTVYIVFMCQ